MSIKTIKVIFILCSLFCVQKIYAGIVIEYRITVEHENALIDRSLFLPERISVSFNSKYVRVQTIGGSIPNRFDFYELGELFYYSCANHFNQKKKFKFKKPVAEITYLPDSVYSVTGYRCKKAIGSTDGLKMEIYFTDAFGVNFFPYGELDGIALKYKLESPYFKSITYEAVSMYAGELPPDIFDVSDYELSLARKEIVQQPLIGKLVPELPFKNLANEKLTLRPGGKVTVLNFWFLGCMPCRKEIPHLNELVKKHLSDSLVQFISIALDPTENVHKFLDENDFLYQPMADGKKAAGRAKVTSYPTHLIIDKSGVIVNRWEGYGPLTVFEISQAIDQLLKEAPHGKSH